MPAIVYDTGALLAAERRNPDFLALHDELTGARIRPLVPVAVLAQAPIVTSDPGDLTRIADSIGVKIRLFRT
jgi:hypothetical protein